MRLTTYVVTVASLTVGAQTILPLGRHLGLPDVKYVAALLVCFLPVLYVRLHPAWKSRGATANAVGLATAGGVLAGVLLFTAALQLARVAGWFPGPLTPRQHLATVLIAVLAPMLAYLVASEVWRKRGTSLVPADTAPSIDQPVLTTESGESEARIKPGEHIDP